MLRALVALLLLANLLLLAWQQGVLGSGLRAPSQAEREPERLQRQVNPEQVRVLSTQAASAALAAASAVAVAPAPAPAADGAASAAAAASAPASAAEQAGLGCLEAGPFAATELPAAEAAMRAADLPAGSWSAAPSQRKGSFMIYMGRYPDELALTRKLEELKRLNVEAQAITHSPDLQPGVLLGRFTDKDAADAALATLVQRGVRSARVATLTAPVTVTMLRLPAADAGLRDRLAALKLPPGQLGFAACATDPRKG